MDYPPGITDTCPDSVSGVSAHIFLTLINALMATKCQISNKAHYPSDSSSELRDQDEFDFVVVGAGSAGSVVANKLSENPEWKVLVLEAGQQPSATSEIPSLLFSLQGSQEDWQYSTVPSDKACLGFKDKTCRWPRGKCLGGSSSINAMLYLRGNKRDYDNWAGQGNEGWDYDSVLSHFREMEDLQASQLSNSTRFGRGGSLPLSLYKTDYPITEVLKESARIMGYPTWDEEQALGYFEVVQTIERGIRSNAGKVFLGKAKERPNLVVAMNSMVEKILIDDTKTARGVVVNVDGKTITVRARKEVIVSSGAVNSPQLLMLSGVGPEEHLEELGVPLVQDLRVGENLQDHQLFIGLYVSLVPLDEDIGLLDEIYQYFVYQRGKMAQIRITNLLGFINTKNNSEYPNLQLHHVLFTQKDDYLLPEIIRVTGVSDEVAGVELETNQQASTMLVLPTLLNPKSRGRILLRSKSAWDKPLIHAGYYEEEEDLEVVLEGIRYVERQLETEPFKGHRPHIVDLKIPGCKGFEFRSDDYWRCAIRHLGTTVYHPVGTCKMGPRSDPGAVVDSRLRVHGVKSLRVIDASIMPAIVSVNTNGPAMMIGHKGATMVMQDWGYVHDEL